MTSCDVTDVQRNLKSLSDHLNFVGKSITARFCPRCGFEGSIVLLPPEYLVFVCLRCGFEILKQNVENICQILTEAREKLRECPDEAIDAIRILLEIIDDLLRGRRLELSYLSLPTIRALK